MKSGYKYLLPIIACLFVLIYSSSTSPFFAEEGADSAVFKTMGLALLKGKIPYLDIFDHKGPVLYFIQAFGQWLVPGRLGIMLLQCISLAISLFLIYKIANLFVCAWKSFVTVIFSISILSAYYAVGNTCEEWELPFLCISTYLSIKFLSNYENGKHPPIYGFVYGLCFAAVFLIRPNDAVAQIGGVMLGVFLYLCIIHEYKNALINFCLFLCGVLFVSLPVFLWYAIHNAVCDMLYGLIGHNMLYSEGILTMLKSVFVLSKLSKFIWIVSIIIMAINAQKKKILFALIPMALFSMIFIGPRGYEHYYIATLCLYALWGALMVTQKNWQIVALSLCLFLCSQQSVIVVAKSRVKYSVKYVANYLAGKQVYVSEREFYEHSEKLFAYIPENEQDSIWNYNLMWDKHSYFSVLWHHGVVQSNYVTLHIMCAVDPNIMKRNNIYEHMPKWVLLNTGDDAFYYSDNDREYLMAEYDTVVAIPPNIGNLALFKKKEQPQ